jgi:pseudo-rSAM protein
MEKQYWFYIEPYVHISVKNRSVLFYNSYSGKIIEYIKKPILLKLVNQLNLPVNLRVIPLKDTDLNNAEVREFVDEMKNCFMGDLLDRSYSEGKPIQMPPMLKIKKDVKYLKADILRSEGEDMMEYLSEVSIYINDRCSQNCSFCSTGYRQFPCCTSGKSANSSLDTKQIESIFNEVKGCNRLNLNILGGDIFYYPNFEKLAAYFSSLQYPRTYFLHYLNAAIHIKELKMLSGIDTSLKIFVSSPMDIEKLRFLIEAAGYINLKIEPIFIIRGEADFEESKKLLLTLSIENPLFHVFYDGDNLKFFEKNVYIGREDIEGYKPSLKDIYARESINSNYFGTLTILSNCRIYADLNSACLGSIGRQSIYDVLLKEMKFGRSWRKTRKTVIPCKYCNYEKLCPPISNYNSAIGKYNLCRIWEASTHKTTREKV